MPRKYDYDWNALMQEQKASGMNMKRFCISKDIPYSAFKNHVYKKREMNPSAFVPLKLEHQEFVCLTLNGVEVKINTSIDDASLTRIMKALIS